MTHTTHKSQLYTERHQELLDSSLQLFLEQGYEATSVQNILDAAGIAKGTFYHYFKSKEELLEQIVERETAGIRALLEPVLNTPLNALDKLNLLFERAGIKKLEKKETLMWIARSLHDKNNVKMRDKQAKKTRAAMRPIIVSILAQGISEGIFDTLPAEDSAELILDLLHNSQSVMPLFLALEQDPTQITAIQARYRGIEFAMERVLGLEAGQIKMVSHQILEQFSEELCSFKSSL